jgi:hypothetical protein
LVVLAVTAVAVWGADNSIGTWKLNLAKSKYTPAPMPLKSYTAVREAAPGGVKVTITGERADGSPVNANYTAKFDGSPAAVNGTGMPYDTISIKQIDANSVTYEAKLANSKYHTSGRTVVSSDGKTMTTTAKGTSADGKAIALSFVYEKKQ